MDAILSYLLSFWGVVSHIASWAVEHPDAAGFYALLVNLIVAKVPKFGGYGKDAIDIFGKAVQGAVGRKGAKALLVICCLSLCVSCVGFGKWSEFAKARLEAFGAWADTWIGGALKLAPVVIAGVEAVTGETNETQAATAALAAASSALGAYHAVVATGEGDAAQLQSNVTTAIQQVSATFGAVQATAAAIEGQTSWGLTPVDPPLCLLARVTVAVRYAESARSPAGVGTWRAQMLVLCCSGCRSMC